MAISAAQALQAQGPPLAIAHAFGNRRELVVRALQAGVDVVEVDVWFWGGRFWARHERRLGFLPVLLDRRRYAYHGLGPWVLPLGPFYIRLDLAPLPLEEVAQLIAGRALLLWDAKGSHSPAAARRYAHRLREMLRRLDFSPYVMVCGQDWQLLETIGEHVDGVPLLFTVETPRQWEALLGSSSPPQGLSLHRALADEARTSYLRARGIPFLCWTVDDQDEATRLLSLGARGIISNRLDLLVELRSISAA
jgi:hypothetical protein